MGALFVLSSLGVLGLRIGKVADLFTSYRERHRLGHYGIDDTDHIVIFGWNRSTTRIVEQIRSLDRLIVIVTRNRHHVVLITSVEKETALESSVGTNEGVRR